jgi:hypothetical protein
MIIPSQTCMQPLAVVVGFIHFMLLLHFSSRNLRVCHNRGGVSAPTQEPREKLQTQEKVLYFNVLAPVSTLPTDLSAPHSHHGKSKTKSTHVSSHLSPALAVSSRPCVGGSSRNCPEQTQALLHSVLQRQAPRASMLCPAENQGQLPQPQRH